jgi:hypothetical protein
MKVHRVGRVGGAIGVILLLGGCEVEVNKPGPHYVAEGRREPPPPPPPAANGARPVPAAPAQPTSAPYIPAQPGVVQPSKPANPSLHIPLPPSVVQPGQPGPIFVRPPIGPRLYTPPPPPPPAPLPNFVLRIVHPLPLPNLGVAQLDIPHIILRLGRRCGPAQLGGGHWIHLDCNVHQPILNAQPVALLAHKIRLMQTGGLRLTAPVAAALPDAVDHRIAPFATEGPIKDQGQVGSCTAFSLSSAMDNGILRQNAGDSMSSMHIWSHYGFPAMQNAASATLNRAIASAKIWPYDERIACELDQSGEPGDCGPYNPPVTQGGWQSDGNTKTAQANADKAGLWKVTEFDAAPTDPNSIATLLAAGSDVWFSMDIGNSWMNPTGDTIADWDDNSIDGGHAVLFAGYRHVNGQRQFLVHNSWGSEWGNNGYAYISEAMVNRYIKTAYKVVVASTAAPPPPSPNPTPPLSNPNALTDDDCSATQLVDSVTGQCATMCPDDSRPANGQCAGATGGKHTPPKH